MRTTPHRPSKYPVATSTETCRVNPDGAQICGGTLQKGLTGYTIASMGAPNPKCAAFGIHVSQHAPYVKEGLSTASKHRDLAARM